jgi:hypothetical protein
MLTRPGLGNVSVAVLCDLSVDRSRIEIMLYSFPADGVELSVGAEGMYVELLGSGTQIDFQSFNIMFCSIQTMSW